MTVRYTCKPFPGYSNMHTNLLAANQGGQAIDDFPRQKGKKKAYQAASFAKPKEQSLGSHLVPRIDFHAERRIKILAHAGGDGVDDLLRSVIGFCDAEHCPWPPVHFDGLVQQPGASLLQEQAHDGHLQKKIYYKFILPKNVNLILSFKL
ncbi:hypothetical protein GGTG_02338 [Gaeumannomyces tritici R3-111a-1]|uniref:Uncharacterized protein n=1 Tax=Gaeumannomyces tritici (strain R3-111a-1) TaxID=644352 RepID=J3NM34_GAET3|nr:hypothetical protein GGTG_02338 [Gaeumannomyces tritici R3-111a-1]EJT82365.1 hypothetical protein GGTG_02338 [Gaeumannomyces tritici R3-111a-1]